MSLIRVVVADDSPFMCRLLKKIIESTSELEVIATVNNGEELLEIVKAQSPDVITLNSRLSDLKALEVLSLLHEECPTPAVIISGANLDDSTFALSAIEFGVVDFIFKFSPGDPVGLEQIRNEVISKIKIAAMVNARLTFPQTFSTQNFDVVEGIEVQELEGVVEAENSAPEVVIVVGASTGGPIVIRDFLASFPDNFSGSVVVVQHLPPTFTTALAALLGKQTAIKVKEAVEGERLERGMVYVSPGWTHLQINEEGLVEFLQAKESPHYCPSIDLTMKAVAEYYKDKSRGILLTGMGQDGISGLREIQANGGRTYVQDPESCTISGMPQRAIEAGVVDHIALPAQLARLVTMGY